MQRKTVKTILGGHIQRHRPLTLTNEQLVMLNNERDLHIAGITKSYSPSEAIQIIKGDCSLFK